MTARLLHRIVLVCDRCGAPFRANNIVQLGPCCRRRDIDKHETDEGTAD